KRLHFRFMKNPLIAAILLLISVRIPAQLAVSSGGSGATTAQNAPFVVVQRDANSRVWARTNYEKAPSGETLAHVHRYTELASGMHYRDPQTGNWIESKEQIDILP